MLYQFIKTDGEIVGTKATPNWIYLQDNGYYGLCDLDKCEGVVIDNIPYRLEDREGLSNLESVTFIKITEKEYEAQLLAKQQEILDIITGGIDIAEGETE